MKYRDAPMPRDQMVLIPTFLDDLIPEDDPIRLFDEILDLLDWSIFNESYRVEKRGQPPLPPRIVAAVLIFGIYRHVRSSRKLEYQLKVNIEFMWLAHGHRIDHDTFCTFRRKHKKAIKKLHRDFIRFAKQLDAVKLAELYVDGTRIQADANRSRTMTAAKATALLEKVDREIGEKLQQLELVDQNDELFEDSGEQLPDHLHDLKQRRKALQEIVNTCKEADAERKRQGTDPEKNPFQLPLTDQDSRILPNKEGGYAPNYTPIIGVEGGLGLIVTTTLINSPNEQDQLIGMVDDVEESYGVTVEMIGADAAYSIGTNIVELEDERGKDFLSPHRKGDVTADNPAIREDLTEPVAEEDLDKLPLNPMTKKYDLEAFVHDPEQNVLRCPQGCVLRHIGKERKKQSSGKTVTYDVFQAELESCEGCPSQSRCRNGTGHKNGRRVRRDEHEESRQRHRQKMSQADTKKRYSKRFSIGEKPFGIIKRNLNVRRFLTRGMENVESEWSLLVSTHNIFRIMNFLGSRENLRAHLTTTT